MWKYTVQVDGMMCGMCEAHANDAIRKAFKVKKVNSSHAKGETVFITEDEVSQEKVKEAFEGTGYEIGEMKKEPAKKGILGWS